MKKNLVLAVCCLLQIGSVQAQNKEKYPQGIEHVIVIGIDAMSVEGLKKASTPNMDKLMSDGVLCNRVRTVLPSSSAANWASMLAGAGTEIHSVTSNDWSVDDLDLLPVVVNDYGFFPTVLSVVRAQRPNDEIGMLYNWKGFGNLFEKGVASIDKSYPTERETALAIAQYIKEKKPTFVFSQLDEVDGGGHTHGHMTEGYLNSISKVDELVGIIVKAIQDAGIVDKTLVMVVSDHGGIGYGHGGNNWEEVTVPFILSGKGVKKNYIAPTDIYMFDVAPTITFALGLNDPYAWRGKAIKCAFEGFDTPKDPLPIKRYVNAPLINGGKNIFEQAGGLYIDKESTQVTIETEYPNSAIYYTTDGTEPTQSSNKYSTPFTVNRTTVVRAKSYTTDGKTESMIADGFFRFVKSNSNNGVNITFYQGKELRGIPKFAEMKPIKSWKTSEIQVCKKTIDSIREKDESSFGVVFTTKLEIDEAGEYTFYLHSDDGSCLYIDGKQIVNNDGDHSFSEKRNTATLTKGKHDLHVEFINGGGGYWIELYYKGPNVTKQIIPANKLFLK